MPRLAIAHDWLVNRRGAERLLKEFCLRFEDLRLYTLFARPRLIDEAIGRHPVRVSPLSCLPGIQHYYRYLLPLFPWGMRRLEVGEADALLSISHLAAKAIPHDPSIPHICYCLTPARFLWAPELYEGEFGRPLVGPGFKAASARLKRWDLASNAGVDAFVAISETVRERIRRFYQRDSEVIHPCIDLDLFRPADVDREDFFLMVSGLVPHKRIDLAVEAFRQSGRPLRIVGEGPSRRRLARLGAAANIRLLGWVPDSELVQLYRRARALVFPSLDEFGLVPVEAQACGCPVIAYGKGGATETVVEGQTGFFFRSPTPEALSQAVVLLEAEGCDPQACVSNAQRFSQQRFHSEWSAFFAKMGLRFAPFPSS